jgi:hypothetical protein
MWIIALGVLLIACAAIAGERTPANDLVTALTSVHRRHTSVETTTDADGHTKVVVRGRHFDGRPFLRALSARLLDNDPAVASLDIDLDLKVATLNGFNDEALDDAEVKVVARGGEIQEFNITGKFDSADLKGELRERADHRHMVYLETNDAGTFLRWIDVYRRVQAGRLLMAVAAPTADHLPQDGIVSMRDFTVTAEPAWKDLFLTDKAGRRAYQHAVFSRLRMQFTASPSQVSLTDGHMTGSTFDANIAGKVDLSSKTMDIRGVALRANQYRPEILPASVSGQLFGLRYTLAGPLQKPGLRLDNAEILTPGFLRQFFSFKPDGLDLMP